MNIFQVFNYITVCMHVFPVIMSFCGCLSACLCVITGQKIDQAGGSEILLMFGLIQSVIIAIYSHFVLQFRMIYVRINKISVTQSLHKSLTKLNHFTKVIEVTGYISYVLYS